MLVLVLPALLLPPAPLPLPLLLLPPLPLLPLLPPDAGALALLEVGRFRCGPCGPCRSGYWK